MTTSPAAKIIDNCRMRTAFAGSSGRPPPWSAALRCPLPPGRRPIWPFTRLTT